MIVFSGGRKGGRVSFLIFIRFLFVIVWAGVGDDAAVANDRRMKWWRSKSTRVLPIVCLHVADVCEIGFCLYG